MNETDIRKYAGLMKELGLTGLEINEESKTVRLERNINIHEAAVPSSNASCLPAGAEKEEEDYISIKSPMVGVFYSSPAQNADPYVSLDRKSVM